MSICAKCKHEIRDADYVWSLDRSEHDKCPECPNESALAKAQEELALPRKYEDEYGKLSRADLAANLWAMTENWKGLHEENKSLRAEVENLKFDLKHEKIGNDSVALALSDACASNAELREGLRRLANEAHGFLQMADPETHGNTNMNILKMRIEEAAALLESK